MKSLGVLLHISSLPGNFPIGDFGPSAYAFVDLLADNKINYWQILPLGPVDPEHFYSPYTVFSSFALSELYVSPDLLLEEGLVERTDIESTPSVTVDYPAAEELKNNLLHVAFSRFTPDADYEHFKNEQSFWLQSYAAFQALRKTTGKPWTQWADEVPDTELIDYEIFVQYILFQQWQDLKGYAAVKNIKIIGDLPIFTAHNSADVWSFPQYFKLREDRSMAVVAGVPPDYFNAQGQVWNLPLYDWNVLQKDYFIWWRERVKCALTKYDLIRIDHFRGLEACYEIPGGQDNGHNGCWVKTPGFELLSAIKSDFPDMPLIAEDLGVITQEVRKLRDDFNLPGMRVGILDFIDYPRLHGDSEHNIRQHSAKSIVYSTTHDFNTVLGWYNSADQESRDYFLREAGALEPKDYLRYWAGSPGWLVIFPVQDILGLGEAARMNFPGTSAPNKNWIWRLQSAELVQLRANLQGLGG